MELIGLENLLNKLAKFMQLNLESNLRFVRLYWVNDDLVKWSIKTFSMSENLFILV